MKNNYRIIIKCTLSALLVSVACNVSASTPEETGYNIFAEVDQRSEGFVDSSGTLIMILKDKNGATTEREMHVKALEGPEDDGDKTLLVFDTPKDQKGTALLTHQRKSRDDDQWLYLPALKRVKKIASKNKSGPFMGSEFSFEDVGGQLVDDYKYKYVKDEIYDGQACFVVESYPKDENSGYTKMISWVDKKEYRTLKVDFYDLKDSHFKTLTALDFKLYLDKFWRPDQIVMVNLQTGKSTVLQNKGLQFKTGISAADFTQNSLQRAR